MPESRGKLKTLQDRSKIAELVLKHRTQIEIAAELGISPATVTRDLREMQIEWRNSMLADITLHKATELERLNRIESELWVAWEKSKTEGRKRNQQWAIPGVPTQDNPNPKPIPLRASLSSENEQGNPAYMAQILAISDRRCRLLGLDAPIKMELPSGDEDVTKMTVAERTRRALEILSLVSGR